jgi:hypothetical protein
LLLGLLVIGVPLSAGQRGGDPEAAALLARAGVRGTLAASCRGEFRAGHAGEFAVAVSDHEGGGRYLALESEAGTHELAAYSGKPELSCYTVREADLLNAAIARSDTINGRVTAEWDGAVVCGFIEPTIAMCWQFAPEQKKFVRVGGWTT